MVKVIVCALVIVLFVNGQTYNYDDQGKDWVTTDDNGWLCLDASTPENLTMQSPYRFTESNVAAIKDDTTALAIYSHENEASFTVYQELNNYIRVVPTSPKDTLTYDSITYTLEHYIVRGSSEHWLGETASQLEIQSFFKNDNLYAILSHLIDPPNAGSIQADLTFVDNLAVEPRVNLTLSGNYQSTDTELDFLGQGMKAFRELTDAYFYVYEGSLTYPPCTQSGIKWFVGNKAIELPGDKLAALHDKLQYNDTTPIDTINTHGNWRTPPTGHQTGITPLVNKIYTYSTGDAFFAVPATSVLLVTLAALVSTVG